jgi:DNA-binding response OmpR family regulator
MAKILLVNFDVELGTRLSAFLRAERHELCAVLECGHFAEMLKRCPVPIDLVILDVSLGEKYVRDLLSEISSYRVRNGPRPAILCISRVYRGPHFALDLERKGARLLYV